MRRGAPAGSTITTECVSAVVSRRWTTILEERKEKSDPMKPLTLLILGGGAYYLYEKGKNPEWSPFAWFASPGERHVALEKVKVASVPTPSPTVALDPGMSTDQVKQVNAALTTETDPVKIAAHGRALADLGHESSAAALAAKAKAVGQAKAKGASDSEIHKKQLEAASPGSSGPVMPIDAPMSACEAQVLLNNLLARRGHGDVDGVPVPIPISNVFDADTAHLIRVFQAEVKLPATGVMDASTAEALRTESLGDHHEALAHATGWWGEPWHHHHHHHPEEWGYVGQGSLPTKGSPSCWCPASLDPLDPQLPIMIGGKPMVPCGCGTPGATPSPGGHAAGWGPFAAGYGEHERWGRHGRHLEHEMHRRGRKPYGRHGRFALGRERMEPREEFAPWPHHHRRHHHHHAEMPVEEESVSQQPQQPQFVYVLVPADQAHAIVQAQQEGAEGAEGGGGAAAATQQAADAAEGSADAATKGYFSGGGFADYMGMYNYVDPQAQWDFYHGYGAPSYGTPWEGEEPIEESYFPHWW
jgi:peptidoglycan hydrolase-like protein with peptidoglycan-binding domain